MDSAGIILSEITQTERDAVDITYMWSLKKYNKLVDITKRSRLNTENKRVVTSVCVCGGGVRDQEVQTTGYKIGSRMYINVGNIANI